MSNFSNVITNQFENKTKRKSCLDFFKIYEIWEVKPDDLKLLLLADIKGLKNQKTKHF